MKRIVPHTAAPTPQVRLITPNMLPDKGIQYCSNHLRRLVKRGDFPKPVHLSPRKIAWPEQVIDDWIAAKMAQA